jgi:hypothetical protein
MKKQILSEQFQRMQKLAGLINENDAQITLADILTKKGKLDQLKGTYLKIIKGPFTDKPENKEYLNKGCTFLFYDARNMLVGVDLEDGKSVNLSPKELIIDVERANAY